MRVPERHRHVAVAQELADDVERAWRVRIVEEGE
jgi:hypothetical protein